LSVITMLIPEGKYSRASGMIMISFAQSSSQVLVPILGGVFMSLIGIKGLMVCDLMSFFVAMTTLVIVSIPNSELGEGRIKNNLNIMEDVWFGFNYLLKNRGLFWLMMIFHQFLIWSNLLWNSSGNDFIS
jgi:MFS transporter, DHA3 family, macrolide efflux protein